jgi:hypothetical protein
MDESMSETQTLYHNLFALASHFLLYYASFPPVFFFFFLLLLPFQFDVPKTNVQARYDTKVIGSYFPELWNIRQERGIKGLYVGLGPTLLRAFPANAALFLGVESGKKLFDTLVWKE